MSADASIVTLKLTSDEASALRNLVETCLDVDGPAFVSMPEWNPPHEPNVLIGLRAAVLATIKLTPSPKKS